MVTMSMEYHLLHVTCRYHSDGNGSNKMHEKLAGPSESLVVEICAYTPTDRQQGLCPEQSSIAGLGRHKGGSPGSP